MRLSRFRSLLLAVLVVGCAGMQRDCASCSASAVGADWVIVQFNAQGHPFRCWALPNTSVENEPHSDGIYWLDPHGNLVHISNNYNRVQVNGGRWSEAYHSVGLTEQRCREVGAMLNGGESAMPDNMTDLSPRHP